ncbi:hypothetical protein MMC25_005030 [Agyrium rufum]|nr:hypothetical protein [Agyrium rufum]
MTFNILLLTTFFVVSAVVATYSQRGAICQDFTIPLTVTSKNYVYNATEFSSDYDVVDFTTLSSSVNSSDFFRPISAQPVKQVYDVEVFATYCYPSSKNRKNTVILATHGIGTDGRYWNSPYRPEKYSFVDYTVSNGYSVFYYDRVGTGQSTKLSGYVIQLSMQVEILKQLAQLVRSGKYTKPNKPQSLVVAGFSFGSFITNTLVATNPALVDGAIFTGLGFATGVGSFIEAYNPRLASQASPHFSGLDSGYLTWVDLFAQINTYYKQPNYEAAAVEFTEETKAPFPVLEVLSLQYGLGFDPDISNFTGPTLVLTGEYDFFACAGYCPSRLEPSLALLGAKQLEVAIHPVSGHSINFNKNATGAYNVMVDFLGGHGF